MKIVVFTASIHEKYRKLNDPTSIEHGVDYVAFADRPILTKRWQIIRVKQRLPDPCRDAKRYKCLIEDFLDADFSIWIDRHCRLMTPATELIEQLGEADLGLVVHNRRCVYWEARVCKDRKKDCPDIINAQIAQIRARKWPPRAGLFFGGFIVRRHTEAVRRFGKLWWDMIEAGSRRDQLCLPLAVKDSGVKLHRWRSPEGIFKIRSK